MDPTTRATVLLETVETRTDAAAHAAATRGRARGSPSGLAQSERMLAHEHEQHRASGAHQRVADTTRRALPARPVDRLSLPDADDHVGGDVIRLEPPGTDPYAGWCGGRELITPGYPIRLLHGSFTIILMSLSSGIGSAIFASKAPLITPCGPTAISEISNVIGNTSFFFFFRNAASASGPRSL